MTLLPDGIRVLEVSPAGGGAHVLWEVTGECACFRGHFEGDPLLPGITHLALLADAATRLAGRARTISEVKSLRLRRPVRPGDRVHGTLEGPDADGRLRFDLRVEGGTAASGVVVVVDAFA